MLKLKLNIASSFEDIGVACRQKRLGSKTDDGVGDKAVIHLGRHRANELVRTMCGVVEALNHHE